MPSFEIILSAFLAISLTASIISSRARAPYTIILVLFGVAIAGSSLSSILGVSLLYDSLVGGGLFVGLDGNPLPPNPPPTARLLPPLPRPGRNQLCRNLRRRRNSGTARRAQRSFSLETCS